MCERAGSMGSRARFCALPMRKRSIANVKPIAAPVSMQIAGHATACNATDRTGITLRAGRSFGLYLRPRQPVSAPARAPLDRTADGEIPLQAPSPGTLSFPADIGSRRAPLFSPPMPEFPAKRVSAAGFVHAMCNNGLRLWTRDAYEADYVEERLLHQKR